MRRNDRSPARSVLARCTLALAFLLAACAIDHVSPKDPASSVPDLATGIVAGQTPRADVRRTLGAPHLSSAYWRFDLFRAATEQHQVAIALTPWPIPFARFEDQVQRYTLVAYDAEARAATVASGLFRKPAAWRATAPISADFPALHLRAAELMFFVDPEGAREANLLAAPRRRDVFLADVRASKGCTAVLGCRDSGCPDQVAVDAGPVRRLPLRIAHVYWIPAAQRRPWLDDVEPHSSDPTKPWLEALVAIALEAGDRTLAFSAKHLGGNDATKLACRPGEVIWVSIDATANKSFWRPALVDWRIAQDDTMPSSFARRPLVVLDDGQWYVDAEPVGRR